MSSNRAAMYGSEVIKMGRCQKTKLNPLYRDQDHDL